MAEQIVQRREMENSLREAIREQQFRLVYQPRYDVNAEKVVAVEALLRWQHPTLGLLMPDQFYSARGRDGVDYRHQRLGAERRLPRCAA